MKTPPIPKSLLIHSIEYKPPFDPYIEAAEQNNQRPITISSVRVEPNNKLVDTKDGKQVVASTLLFIDNYHSDYRKPLDVDGRVTFNGTEYRVISVQELYDAERLHHWEVYLQ